MNLSNENRLLLYCSQIRIPEATLKQVKNIISLPLDWEEVLASASWYGIAPLLYYNLNKIQKDCLIPKDVMDKLKKPYYGNVARNMYLYKELKRVLEVFYEKGVKVIVLKGAALAENVFGNIGLRPMSDIDIMVKKEDLPHAEKIVSGLGYLFTGGMSQEKYRENHSHIAYIHMEKNIPIEIHWHISMKSHPARICVNGTSIIEGWWEHAKNIEFNGIKALILSPEDLIIHLCLHFLKHRFITRNGGFSSRSAFIQMCDIFLVLKHYKDEIDWGLFKYKTGKYEIDIPVHTTLYIVKKFIGGNDDTLHKALSIFSTESLDKESIQLINKRILIRESDLTLVPSPFIQSQVPLVFHEKIRDLLRYIFPNPDFISKRYNIPLNSRMVYFYYLIRPLSLLLRYRKIIFETPRIKEELIIKRWISSKD